jgi:hypothetical protein
VCIMSSTCPHCLQYCAIMLVSPPVAQFGCSASPSAIVLHTSSSYTLGSFCRRNRRRKVAGRRDGLSAACPRCSSIYTESCRRYSDACFRAHGRT